MADAGDSDGMEAVPDGTAGLILRHIKPHSVMEYKVEVDFTAKVGVLKEEVESVVNVPPAQQEWKYNGVALDDNSRLSTNVHRADATVEVRKK